MPADFKAFYNIHKMQHKSTFDFTAAVQEK